MSEFQSVTFGICIGQYEQIIASSSLLSGEKIKWNISSDYFIRIGISSYLFIFSPTEESSSKQLKISHCRSLGHSE